MTLCACSPRPQVIRDRSLDFDPSLPRSGSLMQHVKSLGNSGRLSGLLLGGSSDKLPLLEKRDSSGSHSSQGAPSSQLEVVPRSRSGTVTSSHGACNVCESLVRASVWGWRSHVRRTHTYLRLWGSAATSGHGAQMQMRLAHARR